MEVSMLLLVLVAVSVNTVTANIEPENMEADVVIILDGSSSFGQNNFVSLLQFVNDFVVSIQPNANLHLGVAQFSDFAREEIGLMPLNNIQSSDISGINYIGGTSNTPAGLDIAYSMLTASTRTVTKKAVIMSDGITNVNTAGLTDAVTRLKTICELIFLKIGYDGVTTYDEVGPLADSSIVTSGTAADLSLETMTQLQAAISMAEGDSCTPGSPDEVTTCGIFKCEEINGVFVWNRYYTGCPFTGGNIGCIPIGQSVTDIDCIEFQCDGSDCNGGLCDTIVLTQTNAGCTFFGDCKFAEDGVYFKPHPDCDLVICNNGVEDILANGCPTDNGGCVVDGFVEFASVSNNCVEKLCTLGTLTPLSYGCSYMGFCIFPGDTPLEDSPCEFTTCEIIQVNPTITQVNTDTQCNDGGTCHPVGSTWDSGTPCVENACVLNDGTVSSITVITGCESSPGPCTGVGEEFEGTPCVNYTCNPNGTLVLDESGCLYNGQCWPPGIDLPMDVCKNYTCIVDTSVPNLVTETLSISSGCNIGGNCVLAGTVVENGCEEITCHANGSVTTSSSCDFMGICIPIGGTYIGPCEVKTCQDDLSFTSQETGCIIEGVCYEEGNDIPSEGCSLSTCELINGSYQRLYSNCRSQFDSTECIPDSGSDWFTDVTQCGLYSCIADDTPFGTVSAINYGCLHDNLCYMPSDTIPGCPPLICPASNPTQPGAMVIDTSYCVSIFGCFEIGDDWFDQENCTHYSCISQDSGQTASIEETATGCQTSNSPDTCKNDSTVFNGTLLQRCSTFLCEDGNITALDLACYDSFSDSCLPIGFVGFDNGMCLKRTCTSTSATSANLIVENGCHHGEDCIYPGENLTVDCRTYGCLPGDLIPDLISIDGCFDESEQECKDIGSVWTNDDTCESNTCEPSGNITSTQTGCPDANDGGACVPIDGVMDPGDEECVIITCTGDPPSPSKVYTGCPDNGVCRTYGEVWIESCFRYTCVGDPSSPGTIDSEIIGCLSDGECYLFGETKTEEDNECVIYTCQTSATFEVTKAECVDVDDNSCHPDGSSWVSISECGTNTCSRENVPNSYRVNMIVSFTEGCDDPVIGCVQNQEPAVLNCTTYTCESPDFVIDDAGCWDGEQCVAVGTTWRNRCTTYSCELSENGTVINETTPNCNQCLGNNGNGIDIYQNNNCTKLRCNPTTGEVEVVYVGYYAMGRCIRCDGNDMVTDPRTCITYTCTEIDTEPGSVGTYVSQSQGCKHKGDCYPVCSEINDRCTLKKCEAGAWVKTEIQCSDDNGNCYSPGSIVPGIEPCTTYRCVDGDKALTPEVIDCTLDNGGCLLSGDVLEDNSTCTRYECVPSYLGQISQLVITTLSGCDTGNQCRENGWSTNIGMCRYRDCGRGLMRYVKGGCVWRGQCKQIGEKWKHNCVFYKCVLIDSDGEYYRTVIRRRHGCRDCRGRCHPPRRTLYLGCIKQYCLPWGRLITLGAGCWNRLTKRCVSQGTTITPWNQNMRQCQGNGYDPSRLPLYCVDADGNQISINELYEDKKFCIRYKCMARYGRVELEEVSRGCSYKGFCLDVGAKIRDYNKCRLVKCKAGRNEYRRLVIRKGCRKCGKCNMVGTRFTCNCRRFMCKLRGSVLLWKGCKWRNKCFRPGQSWVGQYGKHCYEYKCNPTRNGSYGKRGRKTRICTDANGRCRRIGDAYYPCFQYAPKPSYGFCSCRQSDTDPQNERCSNPNLGTSSSPIEYCKYYGRQGYVAPANNLSYLYG